MCRFDISQRTRYKDTTDSSMSASHFDVALNRDINGKLTHQLYGKMGQF